MASIRNLSRELRRARARIRYRAPEVWADVTVTGPGAVHLDFDEPQRAVTPGQSVVFYDGEVCLGGGVIEIAEPWSPRR